MSNFSDSFSYWVPLLYCIPIPTLWAILSWYLIDYFYKTIQPFEQLRESLNSEDITLAIEDHTKSIIKVLSKYNIAIINNCKNGSAINKHDPETGNRNRPNTSSQTQSRANIETAVTISTTNYSTNTNHINEEEYLPRELILLIVEYISDDYLLSLEYNLRLRYYRKYKLFRWLNLFRLFVRLLFIVFDFCYLIYLYAHWVSDNKHINGWNQYIAWCIMWTFHPSWKIWNQIQTSILIYDRSKVINTTQFWQLSLVSNLYIDKSIIMDANSKIANELREKNIKHKKSNRNKNNKTDSSLSLVITDNNNDNNNNNNSNNSNNENTGTDGTDATDTTGAAGTDDTGPISLGAFVNRHNNADSDEELDMKLEVMDEIEFYTKARNFLKFRKGKLRNTIGMPLYDPREERRQHLIKNKISNTSNSRSETDSYYDNKSNNNNHHHDHNHESSFNEEEHTDSRSINSEENEIRQKLARKRRSVEILRYQSLCVTHFLSVVDFCEKLPIIIAFASMVLPLFTPGIIVFIPIVFIIVAFECCIQLAEYGAHNYERGNRYYGATVLKAIAVFLKQWQGITVILLPSIAMAYFYEGTDWSDCFVNAMNGGYCGDDAPLFLGVDFNGDWKAIILWISWLVV